MTKTYPDKYYELIAHALHAGDPSKRGYRNYFVADEGSEDCATWGEMVGEGLAEARSRDSIVEGYIYTSRIFRVTAQGEWIYKKFVEEKAEEGSMQSLEEFGKNFLEGSEDLGNYKQAFDDMSYLQSLDTVSITVVTDDEEADSKYEQAKVVVSAWFTEWEEKEFFGETWYEALFKAAEEARTADAENLKHE